MVSLNPYEKNVINYSKWNYKIAQHFFNEEIAGSTVYLHVTENLINSLGEFEGVDYQDFIKAVKNSAGITKNGVCQKALQTMEDWKWRCGRQGYPPYIGYLAFFVLASGTEDDFSPNAYYPRLRKLLGESPVSKPYPVFDEMQNLWKDLEKWANNDKSGELGFFNINITGRLVHVGIPISQTLLTERELKVLPFIFAEAGLEPISLASERYMASLLVRYGRTYLRKTTLKLLEKNRENEELHRALIERIIDELRTWDGTAENYSEGIMHSESKTRVYGVLRLCCKLDSISKRASFTLRCTTNYEFPDNGLILHLNNDDYLCHEHGNSWSSPIRGGLDNKNIDASQLDWYQGLQMQSDNHDKKWYFKLPASPIRIFVEGKNIGLPGLVEVGQVPQGLPFYLLAHQECNNLLETWGASSCEGFEKLSSFSGLPRRWDLFKVACAQNDEIVRNKYLILSFSTGVRLDLQGGIRIEKGNRFFKFAPPKIVLQTADKLVKVYCNAKLLKDQSGLGIYELSLDIPADIPIEIEARKDDDVLKRLSLFLVEDFPLATTLKTPSSDNLGLININQDESCPGVIGGWVKGSYPAFNFNTLLPIQGKQRVLFLGKESGQVVTYPEESIPVDWHPVWLIAKGNLFDKAMFCGTSLKESEPKISTCRDQKKLTLWKRIFLDRRILPPIEDNRMKQLWYKFQKGAKRV